MQFHVIFIFLFSTATVGYETLEFVEQNEQSNIYFCIFAEREITRESTGNVAKRIAKNEKLPNVLHFAKIFLPRKFL